MDARLCRLPPLNGCTRTSLPKFSRSCHARRLLGSLEQCLRSSAYRLAQEGLADLGMCLIVRLASTGCVSPVESVPGVNRGACTSIWLLALRLELTTAIPCWLGHQRPSQTGFNVCLTRQPEWSVVRASLIAACPNCFTPSYIGWTFLSVSSINLES